MQMDLSKEATLQLAMLHNIAMHCSKYQADCFYRDLECRQRLSALNLSEFLLESSRAMKIEQDG